MARFMFKMATRPAVEMDLPSVAEAKREAARYVGRIVRDEAAEFWKSGDLRLTVSDDKGLLLFTIDVIGHEAPALRVEMPLRS